MGTNQKRQQTMAKRAREQALRERRERKQEKKAERRAQAAAGPTVQTEESDDRTEEI